MMTLGRGVGARTASAIGLAALLAAGCGQAALKTYPVRGRVVLAGGSAEALAGGGVEGVLESDADIRSSGTIEPDGTFTLQTQHEGAILPGAPEGTFKARIILPDDDAKARRQAAKAVAAKYAQFNTSGLSFRVPADGEVVLNVTAR